MNRTLKEAPVQRFHYQTTDELNEHLQAFLLAYNRAKRLETLRRLTPHEFVCAQWQKNPAIFTRDLTRLMLGLYPCQLRLWNKEPKLSWMVLAKQLITRAIIFFDGEKNDKKRIV